LIARLTVGEGAARAIVGKTALYAALKTKAEGNTPASKQVVRGSFT
jgi:hypothetical protein